MKSIQALKVRDGGAHPIPRPPASVANSRGLAVVGNRSTVGAIFLRFQRKMTIMTIIASGRSGLAARSHGQLAEAKEKFQRTA